MLFFALSGYYGVVLMNFVMDECQTKSDLKKTLIPFGMLYYKYKGLKDD